MKNKKKIIIIGIILLVFVICVIMVMFFQKSKITEITNAEIKLINYDYLLVDDVEGDLTVKASVDTNIKLEMICDSKPCKSSDISFYISEGSIINFNKDEFNITAISSGISEFYIIDKDNNPISNKLIFIIEEDNSNE